MEQIIKTNNHEVWHTCEQCGYRFDMRKDGEICPKCDTKRRADTSGRSK